MNTGAIVMLLVGTIGLWGGLVAFILYYVAAVKQETEEDASGDDNARESGGTRR